MNQLSRALSAILCSLVLIATGCSGSDKATNNTQPPNQATASIGPSGGSINLSNEIELVIPAGALADTIDFTIQEKTSIPAHPDSMHFVSPVFTIDPGGTNFTTPCTLSIHYTQALVGTQDESSLQISVLSFAVWTDLSTELDTLNNVATAEITHLSDFSVTFYVRTVAGPELRAILDASAASIEYWTGMWSNLHRMFRFIDYRNLLPAGMTYSRPTGLFRFSLDIGSDGTPDYDVRGFVLGGPLTYSWYCLDSAGGFCIDSILIPDTTVGPPAALSDGLHTNEVAIITWLADSDLGPGLAITGIGTFSLRMLSNDAYTLMLPRENRLYPSDTSSFEVVQQANSWNLIYYLPPESNWSTDRSVFIWPTGTTEFVTRIAGVTDSLYALLTYQHNDTVGNIHATYGADTADASIDWQTFLIGD